MDSPEVVARAAEIRNPACLVGSGHACRLSDLGDFKDRSGKVPGVHVLRCETCGLGVAKPDLPDVSFLYDDRTSQDFQPNEAPLTRALKRIVFKREARAICRKYAQNAAIIIDFACGSGLFTRCLAEEAAGSTVVGADFHAEPPHELADGRYLPVDRLDEFAGKADLVLAMHVLEHDDDPGALLARIVRLVRPGGMLIVETPNIDCIWISVFGKAWDAWYLPYHRRHFNKRNLRALVEAQALSVLAERNISVPTMGRTLANMLGVRNNAIFVLVGAALHPIQWALERVTGKPVAIRIAARKA